jgi:hypothetical protein
LKKLLLVLLLAGCGRSPADGLQICASSGRRCPDGFACYPDNRCWRPPGPSDGGAPGAVAGRPVDARFEPVPSRPGPAAYRQVAGGQWSSSPRYRLIRSLLPPPGSSWQQSQHYRMVGGLVGSTQR